jgi:hypothetical protein
MLYFQKLSTSWKYLNEAYESRGPEKSFEYGMYEVRLFVEMVLKGSVVILEVISSSALCHIFTPCGVFNLPYKAPSWPPSLDLHRSTLIMVYKLPVIL